MAVAKRTSKSTKKTKGLRPKPPKAAVRSPVVHFVNRETLGKLMGVHEDRVSNFTRAGMPVVTKGGHSKRSKYDAIACLEWQRNQSGRTATESPKERAQTRAFNAQAEINEMKMREQRGELLDRAVVFRAGRAQMKALTSKLRALPRRFVQVGIIGRDREAEAAALVHELQTEIAGFKTIAGIEAAGEASEP